MLTEDFQGLTLEELIALVPKEHRLPELSSSNCRTFVKCNECGRPAFYDFVPYSLSNPIRYLLCGHGAGRFHEYTTEISEREFYVAMLSFEDKES